MTPLLATLGMAGSASAATSCSAVPTVYGIPPWGFHTGSYTGASSFAKGHGNINLEANTVSGVMCQQDRAGTIIMSVQHHLVYHSHYAMMWGYPGNIMKIKFRVTSSSDRNAKSAPSDGATLYASYNGVRSDSVQFFFPAACKDQDHLYHGIAGQQPGPASVTTRTCCAPWVPQRASLLGSGCTRAPARKTGKIIIAPSVEARVRLTN